MDALKKFRICHNGLPLYSIDIDSNDQYVVTGGLLDDKGCVTVWNFPETDHHSTRMLFRGSCHIGCVNAVRWQPTETDESSFASGGADGLINIWHEIEGPKWDRSFALKGHSGDVLGIEWFPSLNPKTRTSDILASCSVDCRILIWNVPEQEIIAKLVGHTDIVKGIAWDPVGRYIVSQSEDRSMIIWQTHQWKIEGVYKKCFKSSPNDSHFLRLSFSPSGDSVIVVNCVNNRTPVCQIITRSSLGRENENAITISLVGHSDVVQVAKFSPRSYDNGRSLIALAGRDCSISIWSSDLNQPIAVVRNFFLGAVVDLAWASHGKSFAVCSLDGTVGFFYLDHSVFFDKIDSAEKIEADIVKTFGERNNLHRILANRVIPPSTIRTSKTIEIKVKKARAQSGGEQDLSTKKKIVRLDCVGVTTTKRASPPRFLQISCVSSATGSVCSVSETRFGYLVNYCDIWTRLLSVKNDCPLSVCSNALLTHVLLTSGIFYSFLSSENGRLATDPFMAVTRPIENRKAIISCHDRNVFICLDDRECWVYRIESYDSVISFMDGMWLPPRAPYEFSIENQQQVHVQCSEGQKFRYCQTTKTWRMLEKVFSSRSDNFFSNPKQRFPMLTSLKKEIEELKTMIEDDSVPFECLRCMCSEFVDRCDAFLGESIDEFGTFLKNREHVKERLALYTNHLDNLKLTDE